MKQILTYNVTSNGLARRGGNARSSLVPGTYKPSDATTGSLATQLPAYNSAATQQLILTVPGQVFQNLTIFGDIVIRTTDITFKNCILRGGSHLPANASGIIDCNNGAARRVLIEDCTLYPQRLSYNRDGVVGHDYTARRCEVYGTTDGFGAFITTANGTDANVAIEACYVHDLTYFYPDAVHTDGTHNDGCQIQGGANIHLIGNYFFQRAVAAPGTGINPNYPRMLSESPTHANGAGTIIQKQSSTAPLVNVVVEKNWYSNGNMGINMKPGNYTVRENKFSRIFFDYNGDNPDRTPSMYVMRGDDSTTTTVNGINTNVWEDTGATLKSVATGGDRSLGKASDNYTAIRWNNIAD